MTVLMSKPSLNLREELAALRNQGGYSEQAFHKNGLVTNGTFDSDTSGWLLTSGTKSWNSAGYVDTTAIAAGEGVYHVVPTVIGKTYTAHVASAVASTSHRLRINESTGVGAVIAETADQTTPSAFNVTFSATTTETAIYLRCSSAGTVSWDNVSVFETDGSNLIHSLPAGWLPKDVFVNGLLKREGSGWDYTVHTDGTKHWIKPTVAPSATTTTTILGVRA